MFVYPTNFLGKEYTPPWGPNEFVSVWKTDNSGTSSSNQISLPLTSGLTYNMTVDWGDETTSNITSWFSSARTHTYPAAGTYTVRITGSNINSLRFSLAGDRLKLLEIKQWGNYKSSTNLQFQGCQNLYISASDAPTIIGTTMERVFELCNLGSMKLGGFNVSAITDFRRTFKNSNLTDADFTNFDVSSATDMTEFLNGNIIPTSRYDDLLNYWNTLTLQNGVIFDAGGAKYSIAGSSARSNIISTYGWSITDGGMV